MTCLKEETRRIGLIKHVSTLYLFSILFSLTMIANKKVRADILETNNQRKKKAAEKLEKAKEAYVLIIHLF